MNLSNLKKVLSGQPKYRHNQVWRWIFVDLIDDWNLATNLSTELKNKLNEELPLEINCEVIGDKRSSKAIIRLSDEVKIESVLIRNKDGRNTVCVSSQVGCPLGCLFCATGKMGFVRNLSIEEIILQVLVFARLLKKENERVDNVVFMGMGEPFLNWENVKEAILLLNNPEGFNIGARSISISTCGLLEGIEELIKFPLQVNLAVSLHASNDDLRSRLMPIANTISLRDLLNKIKKYLIAKKRKVMLEYLLIDEVNDSTEQALELVDLIRSFGAGPIMINLLNYNPTGKFKASSSLKVNKFRKILTDAGIETIIRESVGAKIVGACGQLATEKK